MSDARPFLLAMLLLVLIAVMVVLGGCATYQEQRALIYAPAPLNAPSAKAAIASSYASAVQAASTDPRQIPAMIDAGNTVNTLNCGDWLSRVTASKRGLVLSDKNLGVLEGLGTTLMGIGRAASSTVAMVGALEVAAAGISTNVQTDLLLAPSAYTVQTTLLGLLDACSTALSDQAPLLSFGQAYTRLEACSRVCSFESAQAAANQALNATPMEVHPASGALMLKRAQ